MPHRLQPLTTILAAALHVAACTNRDDRHVAEQVLAHHFAALGKQAYDAALNDYDDLFFQEVPRADWRNALASVGAKLGPVQQYDITVYGLESKRIAGPGTYLKFKCIVTYAKSTSEETLFLFRREGSDKFKILGHQIDSEGLVIK